MMKATLACMGMLTAALFWTGVTFAAHWQKTYISGDTATYIDSDHIREHGSKREYTAKIQTRASGKGKEAVISSEEIYDMLADCKGFKLTRRSGYRVTGGKRSPVPETSLTTVPVTKDDPDIRAVCEKPVQANNSGDATLTGHKSSTVNSEKPSVKRISHPKRAGKHVPGSEPKRHVHTQPASGE